MSKFFKVILMIFILLCFCINSVFATNTARNTQGNNTTTTNSTNSTSQSTTTVTTLDDIQESGLGSKELTNALNLLLITVGVVIIFLAIAILIRLK